MARDLFEDDGMPKSPPEMMGLKDPLAEGTRQVVNKTQENIEHAIEGSPLVDGEAPDILPY